VASRADGVPLFMEELFRALCDSGAIEEKETAYQLTRPLDGTAIPATLQDSLMARLDRLAPAKAVAQIGAAIGREFSQPLIESVAGMKEEALAEGLKQLLDAGLLFSRGVGPEPTFIFKHALVQDAAYGSMLRERRQQVHERIAQVLIERSSEAPPELIAHHFEASGNLPEAVEWLDKAGDAATRAAANQETIRFMRRALRLLDSDATNQEAQRQRVRFMQKLAAALIQVEGYGSAEAFELGEAALRIAFDTKDLELYVRVCTTNGPTLFPRQEYDRVERQLARVSEQDLRTTSVIAQSRFWTVRGVVNYHRGRFAEALRDLGTARSVSDDIPASDASFGGGDVRFVARSYLSRAEWNFGLLDKAIVTVEQALGTARKVGDPFSVAWGLMGLGRSQIAMARYEEAVETLDEGIEICKRYGYVGRLGHVTAIRGTARVFLGDASLAASEIKDGLDLWRRSAGDFSLDTFLIEAARALYETGHIDLARPFVDEVGKFYQTGAERAVQAEYHRMEALLSEKDGSRSAAVAKLREAIEIAEAQSANLFRLRASCDLARLLAEGGRAEDARNVLAPVYAWFTEGFDMPDLVAARTLLRSLTR
jgi:tetratricopeptide (TPR) repeat protein